MCHTEHKSYACALAYIPWWILLQQFSLGLRLHKGQMHNYVSTSTENGSAMAGPARWVLVPTVILGKASLRYIQCHSVSLANAYLTMFYIDWVNYSTWESCIHGYCYFCCASCTLWVVLRINPPTHPPHHHSFHVDTTNNLLAGEEDVNSPINATLNCIYRSGFTGSTHCTVQYGTDPTYMDLPYSAESTETGTAGDAVSVVLRERLNSSTV